MTVTAAAAAFAVFFALHFAEALCEMLIMRTYLQMTKQKKIL